MTDLAPTNRFPQVAENGATDFVGSSWLPLSEPIMHMQSTTRLNIATGALFSAVDRQHLTVDKTSQVGGKEHH